MKKVIGSFIRGNAGKLNKCLFKYEDLEITILTTNPIGRLQELKELIEQFNDYSERSYFLRVKNSDYRKVCDFTNNGKNTDLLDMLKEAVRKLLIEVNEAN